MTAVAGVTDRTDHEHPGGERRSGADGRDQAQAQARAQARVQSRADDRTAAERGTTSRTPADAHRHGHGPADAEREHGVRDGDEAHGGAADTGDGGARGGARAARSPERAPHARVGDDVPYAREPYDAPRVHAEHHQDVVLHARVEDDADPGARNDDGQGHARAAEGDRTGGAGTATAWDDGLIARRLPEAADTPEAITIVEPRSPGPRTSEPLVYEEALRARLDALRELVGLSRTRLDGDTLAEAGRVLDEAAARRELSGEHTVVAIAGATGSGKSTLFNALAGVALSDTGVRRPTTAAPIACTWGDGAASLIERLGIPGRQRRRPVQTPDGEPQLQGLVLIDLPDHDSAAVEHRDQVDRVLALVDAVVWVVDPEKYADAVLHERYLRPMAGHAEVMFVVLNQVDRLPGEAAEQVLDDLRRLLDGDGIALGEYGEPGATVLALSALTGDGVGELRELLGQFVADRGAAGRRIRADVDAAAARLRSVYATGGRGGLSEEAREEFTERLTEAVGATAAGEAAEREWLRNASRACGTPWLRLWRWCRERREPSTGRLLVRMPVQGEGTDRQRVEQAVRTVADQAAAGMPAPWAQAVREAASRGAHGLPQALDELTAVAAAPQARPPRPGWWTAATVVQAAMALLQVLGVLWIVAQLVGFLPSQFTLAALLVAAGTAGGPVVEWGCGMAARGPARRHGVEAGRRLREAAAGCGRAHVLDPVAAEVLRYGEVREEFVKVAGAGPGT
ncbi:GTPase [Streptomyces sp. NPDC048664]|uniref:GTPase n=1 Tax=Streptomyces sp. NPDC048664 TaxID=3154505 RepID=UPI003448C9D6